MSSAAPRDPWLNLPLTGVRLVEASAGTGKTFTLATLVTRLVVERKLRIGEILAVTFTEAATQELRKRIRERLQLALAVMGMAAPADEAADAAVTRAIIAAHLASEAAEPEGNGETPAALRRRLHQAVLDTDLAAIFTIHGFCARVLREHAVHAGRDFDAVELLGNDRQLRESVAADLWRQHAVDDAGAEDLAALWVGGHVALAEDLKDLLREPKLRPAPVTDIAQDIDALQSRVTAAHAALRSAWMKGAAAMLDALSAAIDADVMNRNSYKPEWLAGLRIWGDGLVGGWKSPGEVHDKLHKLITSELEKGTKKAHLGKTPVSPFSDAIEIYLQAVVELDDARRLRRIALLHQLRDEARAGIGRMKLQQRLQTYDDLIDHTFLALQSADGPALADALRSQYAVALVDEFQDTDPRQWAIFDGVFGSGSPAPALFVIGDPKQAIYGFRGGDVHAYLRAVKSAEHAPPLSENFRSRPVVLQAIEALYANAQAAYVSDQLPDVQTPPFVEPGIQFHPVTAGGRRSDAHLQTDGQAAPGLTLWRAPEPPADKRGNIKPFSAEESRQRATEACVAAIHALLSKGSTTTIRDKDTAESRRVAPGDIAVLVRTHLEATRIQQALAAVGIPAVAAGKLSLFATNEARELHALLFALLHAGDDTRLRAALATVLIGLTAQDIAALDADGAQHRLWQQRALDWRERLLRGGPFALITDLCAAAGARLATLVDGERRLSNYLQLAELLQEVQDRRLGLHGLVDWLGQRIAGSDPDDETQLLRLESDARRVQIVTLHKSKGLEYPLVFLPFIGIGSNSGSKGRYCIVRDDDDERCLQWKQLSTDEDWTTAKAKAALANQAEDARLLYVALTRAEHALWLASGKFFRHTATALWPMLSDETALRTAGVVFDDASPPASLPRLALETDADVQPARVVSRNLHSDWWVHSFSQLSKAGGGTDSASAATLPATGGNDEPSADVDGMQLDDAAVQFSGNRFGVALHAALERADFSAWRGWNAGDPVTAPEADNIGEALRGEGYPADQLDAGVAFVTRLIGHTLTVALPEGTRLCDVPASERRPEIEFQFSLQTVQVDELLAVLHAHGIVRDRRGFGFRQRLEGLMTGLIDLVYRHDGRWHVLDYKSNRLDRYDAASLQAAMDHSEYDLQALIYTLALHRWLRFRLGDGYDYERDVGGIRYLFCRGLDAARADSPGVHARRFPLELVDALDHLFGQDAADEVEA